MTDVGTSTPQKNRQGRARSGQGAQEGTWGDTLPSPASTQVETEGLTRFQHEEGERPGNGVIFPGTLGQRSSAARQPNLRTRHNQNSLTHCCGAGGASGETTQQHREPWRLIEHG